MVMPTGWPISKAGSTPSAARHAGGQPRTGAAVLADRMRHPGAAGCAGMGCEGDRTAGAGLARRVSGHERILPREPDVHACLRRGMAGCRNCPTGCWTIALGHNLVLLTRLKDSRQRLADAQSAIEHGWSRNALNIHIETRRLERSGTAVTNFATSLPGPRVARGPLSFRLPGSNFWSGIICSSTV